MNVASSSNPIEKNRSGRNSGRWGKKKGKSKMTGRGVGSGGQHPGFGRGGGVREQLYLPGERTRGGFFGELTTRFVKTVGERVGGK